MSSKKKYSIFVIPSILDYKYLKHLYSYFLFFSKQNAGKFALYSIPSEKFRLKRFFYPIAILKLLIASKKSSKNKILHLHWIEFLYRWGDYKFAIPFLIPILLFFFKIYLAITKNRLFITIHNVIPHEIYWWSIERKFFQIMLKDFSMCVFVHTKHSQDLAVQLFDIDAKKIQIIPHGIFGSLKDSLNKLNVRKKFGIGPNAVVFTFVGSISKYKGVELLIKAIQIFLDADPDEDVHFIVAGAGKRSFLDYLSKKYEDVINNKKILFIPKYLTENELEEILGLSDFGICPYITATTPGTLFDFLRFKLPIITSNDPNVSEIFGDFPIIKTEPGDVETIVEAIKNACANFEHLKYQSINYDYSNFEKTWEIAAKKTLFCYKNCQGEI